MSLLLDALKRAEEAKRAKQSSEREEPFVSESPAVVRGDDHPDTGDANEKTLEHTLAPPAAAATVTRSPKVSRQPLALSLEEVRPPADRLAEQPAEEAVPAPEKISARPERGTAEAARTVFAAKQRPGVLVSAASKPWLLPAIAGLVVLLGAGGWYVWKEVSKLTRPPIALATRSISVAATTPSAPAAGLPSMPATTGQGLPSAAPPLPPAEPAGQPALPPLLPPELKQAAATAATVSTGTSSTALTEREAYARRLKEVPVAVEPPVALKLSTAVQPASVNPELARAYEALRNGDLEQARALYWRRVQAEPLSLDAQLGLATVGARGGDRALASRHYREALAIDPRNEIAMAGMMAIASESAPGNQEVQLRTMIGQSPAAAGLHFALGNLLAGQNRWVEAQQAYFEAYRLNADVADHAYNLAVSLDHLGQARLAREYYQKALALVARSAGQFDSAQVTRRVQELAAPDKAP